MNSNLQKLMNHLDPYVINERIDIPIEIAVRTFETDIPLNPSHHVFNRIINTNLQHIYTALGYSLSEDDGYRFLEEHYRNGQSYGYDGAYLDATDECLHYVLNILEEIIKQVERTKYITSCMIQFVDPTDHSLRARIAEELKSLYGQNIHPAIGSLNSAQLSSEWKTLLQTLIESQNDIIDCLN